MKLLGRLILDFTVEEPCRVHRITACTGAMDHISEYVSDEFGPGADIARRYSNPGGIW